MAEIKIKLPENGNAKKAIETLTDHFNVGVRKGSESILILSGNNYLLKEIEAILSIAVVED